MYLGFMIRILSSVVFLLVVSGIPGVSAPLTLEGVIARTLIESERLEAAASVGDLLRLEKRMSLLAFFPRLSGGFSAADTVIYHSPDTRGYRLYANLEQPLFTGGALIEAYRTGKEALEIHRYETERIENAVVFEAVAGYARLILLETLLDIRKMTENLLNRQLWTAEEELDLGLITELTLAKMRIARDKQSLARRAVESESRNLRERLAGELGIEPSASLEPAEDIRPAYSGVLCPGKGVDRFIAQAREHSPQLVARRLEAAAKERKLAHTKRFWIPRVTLKGEVFVTGDRLPLTVPGFSAGIEISVPIPFLPLSGSIAVGTPSRESRFVDLRGSVSEEPAGGGLITAARAASERADLDLRTALQNLEEAIVSSCFGIEQAGSLIDQERELSAVLETEERIAEEELRLGEIGRLEYMEAAAAHASQKGNLLEKQYTQFLRELELYTLLGISLRREALPLYESFLETGG